MSALLQVFLVSVSFVLLIYVFFLVKKGKLQLRYALLWITLAFVILLCSLFPKGLFAVTHVFGFETPANFIFVVGFFFLLLIVLSLGVVASKQADSIKVLTQRLALLEHELCVGEECNNK